MSKDIYDMELHEFITPENTGTYIQRVPGGWIYSYTEENMAVFVPFHNEFQKRDFNE